MKKFLGSFLIRTMPIFIGIYFIRKNYLNRNSLFFLIILIFILEIIIIFTGERTALALMLVFNTLVTILAIKYSKKYYLLIFNIYYFFYNNYT